MTQPLDIGINRLFKARSRRRWEEWLTNLLDTTDEVCDTTCKEVSEWVVEVFWELVGSRILQNAWRKKGYDWFPVVVDPDDECSDDDGGAEDDGFDDSLFDSEEEEEESGDVDNSEDEGNGD